MCVYVSLSESLYRIDKYNYRAGSEDVLIPSNSRVLEMGSDYHFVDGGATFADAGFIVSTPATTSALPVRRRAAVPVA